ncbi:MAG: cellulase family glycosylhydrolase [Chloroflexota bacterium]
MTLRFLTVLALVILALPACGSHPAPVPLRTIPLTDVNPYGVNIFLDREVEEWKMRRELQMIKDAGIGFVKQEIPWLEIEPVQKGQFVDTKFNKPSWDKYDKIVNLINEFGLQAIIRLDQPPNWSRHDNSDPNAPPDNLNDYGDFVYDVVHHLRSKGIRYYQIWSEPNIYPNWGNQPPNPAAYTQMLKIAYQRAKEADPNAVILSAPLAITLETSSRNMSDLAFLQAMYDAGAKPYFDVMSANAYGLGLPPTDPADPNKLNFQRVQLLHDVMVKNDDAAKPVWFDEFGWDAPPPDMSAQTDPYHLEWGRVTEQQQADYTRQAIALARSWPWVGVINIWYFRQDGTRDSPADSEYYFRMVNPDFSPTPLYAAVQHLSQGLQVAHPGQYQETNPALQTSDDGKISSNWVLRGDAQASGGYYYASNIPHATLIITFDGSGLTLDTLKAPDGGIAYVTVDGSSSAPDKLARQADGKAYINFYAPKPEYGQQVPVIDGLGSGKHVLQLTISGERKAPSAGSFAYLDAFTVLN